LRQRFPHGWIDRNRAVQLAGEQLEDLLRRDQGDFDCDESPEIRLG
jgi:hypothetical protein